MKRKTAYLPRSQITVNNYQIINGQLLNHKRVKK